MKTPTFSSLRLFGLMLLALGSTFLTTGVFANAPTVSILSEGKEQFNLSQIELTPGADVKVSFAQPQSNANKFQFSKQSRLAHVIPSAFKSVRFDKKLSKGCRMIFNNRVIYCRPFQEGQTVSYKAEVKENFISKRKPLFRTYVNYFENGQLKKFKTAVPVTFAQPTTNSDGQIRVSRDPSSPGNNQVAPGTEDIVFLKARIDVDERVDIQGLILRLAAGSELAGAQTIDELNNQFDGFSAWLEGEQLGNIDKFVDTDASDNDITTNPEKVVLVVKELFKVPENSLLEIRGNTTDEAQHGSDIRIRLFATDLADPVYEDQTPVLPENILGSAQGSFVEVRESRLEITAIDSIPDGEVIVAGINDVTLLEFVLDINDSGDGIVTSVTIDASDEADLSGSARIFQNFTLALFVDGLQQGSSRNLSAAGQATFNDLNVVIPSASQEEFTLVANTIEASAIVVAGTDQAAVAPAAPITTITLESADATAVVVGDEIDLEEAGIIERVEITGNTAGVLTFAATTNVFTAGIVRYDLVHTIAFDVTELDAQNVENGQNIPVQLNDGTPLGAVPNQLEGALFELVQSGELTILNRELSAFDKVIVANSEDIVIAQFNLRAEFDDVSVGNFNFVNDTNNDVVNPPTAAEQLVDDRVDFKLYDEDGQFVIQEQMNNGTLQFDLANQDRIQVPQDGQTFITIRVDARNITNFNETGHQLRLALDANPANPDPTVNQGIEAFTNATGDDIEIPVGGWGEIPFSQTTPASSVVADSDFLVARTKLSLDHAVANDDLTLAPGTATQGVYRFEVTADNAFDATLDRVSFDMIFTGAELANALNAGNLQLVEYANPAFVGTPVIQSGNWSVLNGDTTGGLISFDFNSNEEVNAGDTRYYEIRISANAVVLSNGNNDRVNVLLLGSADNTIGSLGINRSAALSNDVTANDFQMIWSDRSNNGNPGAYLTGYGLVIPTDTDGAVE